MANRERGYATRTQKSLTVWIAPQHRGRESGTVQSLQVIPDLAYRKWQASFFLFLEFLAGKVRLGGDGMAWGFIALTIVVAVVLAGRAHSRYLDRQDQLYLGHLASPQTTLSESPRPLLAPSPAPVLSRDPTSPV
jgi:hypothetical protein